MVGVLVQDRRDAHPRGTQAAEGGRAVAVQMHDVGSLVLQHLEQVREGGRIELVPAEVGDVDAELLERVVRQVLLPQTDERGREARRVEARHHPGEQPLDPVHAGSGPPEVVAHMHDVQLAVYSHP